MPTQTFACESWAGFKAKALPELFDNGQASRGRFFFRGQGSDEWPVISAFDRWYRNYAKASTGKRALAEKFLSIFREEASRLDPDETVPNDNEEALALAQHYGVPTRLVDWTESPYVAAFFAFAGLAARPKDDHLIAIWCLDTHHGIWNEDTGIKLLQVSSPYNERLKNQLGKFTLMTSPFDTVEEHIEKCDTTGAALKKFTISAGEANPALSDLDFMGINYSTIYPGLEGCAMATTLRVLLQQ